MKQYVLGIDGGGTKSHLAVWGTDGALVGTAVYGPLNHEGMEGSFAQLEQEFGGFVTAALADMQLGVGDIAAAVFGLAGADTPAQCHTLSGMVGRLGFKKYRVTNDAYLGIPAASPNGCGICAINGTGAAIAAIDPSGSHRQVGGIGDFSEDCGGSTWYGTQAIAKVYSELLRSGLKTMMTPLLTERLKLRECSSFAQRLTEAMDEGSVTPEALNRVVFAAAAAGDAVALGILGQSAKGYAGGILHLATGMAFPKGEPLVITLAGSIFVKEPSPILRNLVCEQVRERLPKQRVEFVKLTAPPVAGAVVWALSDLGQAADREQICTVLRDRMAELSCGSGAK